MSLPKAPSQNTSTEVPPMSVMPGSEITPVSKGEREAAVRAVQEKSVQELQENAQKIHTFSDEEKNKFKEVFEKELTTESIKTVTIDDLCIAERKFPGISKMIFTKKADKKTTFDTFSNEDLEWSVGLSELVEKKVSKITLYIHPRNLATGKNDELLEKYPEAKKAHEEYIADPSKITYFKRESTSRDAGDFHNEDGYLRIFSGDHWTEDEILTEEKYVATEKIKDDEARKFADDEEKRNNEPEDGEKMEGNSKKEDERKVEIEGDSILSQLSMRFTSRQLEMAQLIEKKFVEAGYPRTLAAAAIVNAWVESVRLQPGIEGDGGHSIGLFQINFAGGYGTTLMRKGRIQSQDEVKDPEVNIDMILKHSSMKGIVARARAGASISELTGLFCVRIEAPRNTETKKRTRMALSRRMFKGADQEDSSM